MTKLQAALVLTIFCLTYCLTMLAGDRPWVEVRSPHFRVISDASDKDARHAAHEFEQMRQVFATQFPGFRLDSGAPLLILAVRDEHGFRELFPEFWEKRGSVHPAGLFHRSWEKSYAAIRLDAVGAGDYEVVYHEYVHSLIDLNFRAIPVWLNEGLAEFYANAAFRKDETIVGAPSRRVYVLREQPMIPLDQLVVAGPSSPYYRKEDKASVFYAESWALTHFLFFREDMGRGKKLNDFVHLIQQGMEPDKAFNQAIGNPKEIEKLLYKYILQFAFTAGVYKNPQPIDEKAFAARTMSLAETEAELGDFHARMHHRAQAERLLTAALKVDPKLGLAQEASGFLAFAEGKDEEAAQHFAQAYELDNQRYLSLFFKTMLSPSANSKSPSDISALYQAMLQVLTINGDFAPALVQLARLDILTGDLKTALGVARRAEKLEPSRAGYHVLSGKILERMGRHGDAATLARYVAERWSGPDHDEAVELWNSIPEAQRTGGEPLTLSLLPDTVSVEGNIESATCGDKDHPFSLSLKSGEHSLAFRGGSAWMAGFSDTLWYGADHFSLCRHVENLRAIVRYRPTSKDKQFAGELAEIELRDDLPPDPGKTGEASSK